MAPARPGESFRRSPLQPAASPDAQPGAGSSPRLREGLPGKSAEPPAAGAEELPGALQRSASPLSSASRFYRPDASQPAAMPDAPRPLETEAARKPGSGSPARQPAAYFDQPCIQLAEALLGQVSSSAGGGGTTGSCKGAPPLLSRKRAAPVARPPGRRASCGPSQSGRRGARGPGSPLTSGSLARPCFRFWFGNCPTDASCGDGSLKQKPIWEGRTPLRTPGGVDGPQGTQPCSCDPARCTCTRSTGSTSA